jgi:hypothetical protein
MKNGVRPTEGTHKKVTGDGYVQSVMDWAVGMLRFCLKRGEHTETEETRMSGLIVCLIVL